MVSILSSSQTSTNGDNTLRLLTHGVRSVSAFFSSSIRSKYQNTCCNPNASVGSGTQTTPRLPSYTGPVGTERDCPICGTSEYPGKPNQLIVARYVGEYTCGQLFARGFHGMTPSYMCDSLQDFARTTCGCGSYNPVCRSDSSKCYGGRNYKAPYIIPFDTRISSTSAVASTSTKPGSRHLLRGPQKTTESSPRTISAEDLHFEAKDTEGADVTPSDADTGLSQR
jgi:hypothetical protein